MPAGSHDIVATAVVDGRTLTSTRTITVEGKTVTTPPVDAPKDTPVDDDGSDRTIPSAGSPATPVMLMLGALLLGAGVALVRRGRPRTN